MFLKKFSWLIMLAGLAVFVLLMIYAPPFAYWGEATLVMGLFSLILWAADKYVVTDIEIIEELKRGNTAVAIFLGLFMLSFAVIVLGFATR